MGQLGGGGAKAHKPIAKKVAPPQPQVHHHFHEYPQGQTDFAPSADAQGYWQDGDGVWWCQDENEVWWPCEEEDDEDAWQDGAWEQDQDEDVQGS